MKKAIVDTFAAIGFVVTCISVESAGIYAVVNAQVAPTPPPMEGGSPLASDVASHWGALMTSQQDFVRATGALLQDYQKVTNELRQARATVETLQTELARKTTTAGTPAPAIPAPPMTVAPK